MKKILKAPVRLLCWLLGLRLRTLLVTALTAGAVLALLASPLIASVLDGSPQPVDDIDSAGGQPLEGTWGIDSNSLWLVDRALEIVPYFSYENFTAQATYPVFLAFVPNADQRSFHVLGTTQWGGRIRINLRYLTTDRADARDIYATLIHELIHAQGIPFTYGGPLVTEETRIRVEGMTTAGTIEILAAICNYRENDLACPTFWQETGDLARTSLQVRLRSLGLDPLYQFISDALWRDADMQSRAEKAMRFWGTRPEELAYIQTAYGAFPWSEYVVPGFAGKQLPTGVLQPLERPGQFLVVFADFDDTRAIMGPLGLWASVVTWLHDWALGLMP